MTEAQPKKKTSCLTIIIGIGIILLVIGYISRQLGISQPTEKPAKTAVVASKTTSRPARTVTAAPTATSGPSSTPAPTNTPRPPTVTPEPIQALRTAIIKALGEGNRDIPRVNDVRVEEDMIIVDFAINDNLFEDSLIRGAKRDVVTILEAVSKSKLEYGSVLAAGRFSMKDVYGNVSEDQVIGAIYNSTTVDKINFGNFDVENIYTIMDGGYVMPAFNP